MFVRIGVSIVNTDHVSHMTCGDGVLRINLAGCDRRLEYGCGPDEAEGIMERVLEASTPKPFGTAVPSVCCDPGFFK